MNELDALWDEYDDDENIKSFSSFDDKLTILDNDNELSNFIPKCSDIYISTKTKIAYLNQHIDLYNIFWNIPIINYSDNSVGFIKKEIKFNSSCVEELNLIQEKLSQETNYFEEFVITNVVNPNGRITFKDIRKISIGISKKDIVSHRSKKKGMFYNCFVLVVRVLDDNIFKEIHVKIFNTGKMEIPGIQNDNILYKTLDIINQNLKSIIQDNKMYSNFYLNGLDDLTDDNIEKHKNLELNYDKSKTENVLINSNFNCNFYINRQKLFEILKYDYHINCNYDPCSYPGIQCKFYYYKNIDLEQQNGSQIKNNNDFNTISFMIFRTGSILIVGKCEENVLHHIYNFIKNMLEKEYHKIKTSETIIENKDKKTIKKQKNKSKKFYIYITG
jgi:TATA-box binding protein (TBP) (component of TFIID and TFIIIB)